MALSLRISKPPPCGVRAAQEPDKWVCVGKKPRTTKLVKIYNEEVLLYRSKDDDRTLAVRNACPHRGARLSHNGRVESDCVRCAYHGMRWGPRNNADNYLQVKEDHRLVWVNAGLGDGDSEPPTMPEFSDPAYRTFAYSTFISAHPQIVMENLLDYAHLEHVHKVKIVDAKSTDAVTETGADSPTRGKSVYSYPVVNEFMGRALLQLMPRDGKGEEPEDLRISVENEFFLPYTSSLRFMISGHEKAAMVLWFSVLPYEPERSLVTCKVARNILTPAAWDGLFWLLNSLPLKEDDDIVSNVIAEEWWRNRLVNSDTFIKMYRDCLREVYGMLYLDAFP